DRPSVLVLVDERVRVRIAEGLPTSPVEGVEGDAEAPVQVEAGVFVEVAAEVRDRVRVGGAFHGVAEALHRAAGSALRVDEENAQAAADERLPRVAAVPRLDGDARPLAEVRVVGLLHL